MNYEHLYQEEKRNRQNILKMQKTIMADNDQYIMGFVRLKNIFSELRGEEPIDEDAELTPAEAGQLVDQVGSFMRANAKTCECERWRALYRQQSQETLRISQQKQELLIRLQERQEQEALDRVQVNKLLSDYLELFKRQNDRGEKQTEKKREKHIRSKSRGRSGPGQAQTDRKSVRTINISETTASKEEHSKALIDKFERDLQILQSEVKSLREEVLQGEKILRLYRSRQRRHLLEGCIFQ